MYGGFSWSKHWKAISNREDAVLLARLRAGHTPLLEAYVNLLDPFADPLYITYISNVGTDYYQGIMFLLQIGMQVPTYHTPAARGY